MAHSKERRSQNLPGNFYVDRSCIDCDTCRWMAPDVFGRFEGQSAVYQQPQGQQSITIALQALLSCPTASIGTVEPLAEIKAVQKTFPIPIADEVYHCGYHSEKSYAATSYFIRHPQGNILVDSPRFAKPLVKQLEKLGGVRYLYLTHRDDVADHQQYRDHFECDRILHKDDVTAGTQSVELLLTGSEPYSLAEDVLIIPVPGHTQGHTVMLYKEQFLMTGDHLAWSDSLQTLIAFKNFCWYSWAEQTKSMKRLLNYPFEWVLPGHGRRHYSPADQMKRSLQQCVNWMEAQST